MLTGDFDQLAHYIAAAEIVDTGRYFPLFAKIVSIYSPPVMYGCKALNKVSIHLLTISSYCSS